MEPAAQITPLLAKLNPSNPDSASELLSAVYQELHGLAVRIFSKEGPGHTLQPTALLHEAFIRLMKPRKKPWRNRAHFFSVAALVMRRFLVDYARTRNAGKRSGKRSHIELTPELGEQLVLPSDDPAIILDVHDALNRLKRLDRRLARIVELRVFAGLTIDETAEVLDVGKTAVKDDWQLARAWLIRELE
jgi:RNA polymerase sigma factor (TIGR02999 family)